MNIFIIFPGNGNYNFKKILYEFNDYKKNINNIFNKFSLILNINLLKIIKDDNHLLINKYKDYIIIIISLIISNVLNNLLKNLNLNKNNIFLLGYSLGNYSSLIYSKSISLNETIYLLKYRNYLFNNLNIIFELGMIIIFGIHYNTVFEICKNINKKKYEFLKISIINDKYTTTLSGYKKSINKLIKILYFYKNIKKIILPFDKAYHTILMKSTLRKFKKKINILNINNSNFKIIDTVNIKIINNKRSIKKSLINIIYKKINWYKTINFIKNKYYNNFIIELGSKFIINYLSNIKKNYICIKSKNDINNLYLHIKKNV